MKSSQIQFDLLDANGDQQGKALIDITNESFSEISNGSVSTISLVFKNDKTGLHLGTESLYLFDHEGKLIGVVADAKEFHQVSRLSDDETLVSNKTRVLAKYKCEERDGEFSSVTLVAHYFVSNPLQREHVLMRFGEYARSGAQVSQQDFWLRFDGKGGLELATLFYVDGETGMRIMSQCPSSETNQTLQLSRRLEDLESLKDYCTKGSRICPKPLYWSEIYALIVEGGADDLPSPLSQGDWIDAPHFYKIGRLFEQLNWAAENGTLPNVDKYLRSLSDEQWFTGWSDTQS